MRRVFCLLWISLTYTLAQENILQNPGFEDPIDGSGWYCAGCNITQDPDAYSGSYAAIVTDREDYLASISQDVPLQANTLYYFTAYIKLAEQNVGALWHQVDMLVELDVDGGDTENIWIGRTPYLKIEQGWKKIGGDFTTDNRVINNFRLYIQVNVQGENPVPYLLDETSLTPVYKNPNWKQDANARIDLLRKNNVTINLSVTGGYDPSDLEIQVNQTYQAYPFGCTVDDPQLAGDTDYNKRYQDTFYTHFNWAVMENALKWHEMELNRTEIVFPDESIRRLNENGVPVRGHCVFWGVERYVPEWLYDMTAEEVIEEMHRRMDYIVTRYDDQLVHWDVNNEQEHGSWFENKTGNPYILSDMFREVRVRDSDVVLFLNDYEIVSLGYYTQDYVNKAIEVDTDTGEVGGIGVQSHILNNIYPDVHAIQLRLDIASTAGFPIWVTEIDIQIEDDIVRADALDDVMTLYFSHPSVEGILLWGFSDQHHWCPECALFDGDYFVPNAAGLRWQEMMFTRWHTYQAFLPTSEEETFGFRGFHGLYDIQVLNNGAIIANQTFELPQGQDVSVDIEV